MTVESYINEYPQYKSDIDAINKLFEPLNICINEIVKSSQIIRYKLNLPIDLTSQRKIRRAEQDIKFAISTALKCDEVIYNKSEDHVYIERKADSFKPVNFVDIYKDLPEKGLYIILGKDINGKINYTNLSKAPHVLVAGTTGSGKSELLHVFVASLLARRNANPCELFIIDPKRAEFSQYKNKNGIHLLTETKDAIQQLKDLCDIMESRYRILEQHNVKDISQLTNSDIHPLVVIIDELADLLKQDKSAESYIVRIAQKARACGIHLIIGTQTPRKEVLTGLIRANIPTKIALHTTNSIESRLIIEQNGAEHLFGKGDMLYLGNGSFTPIRIQSAYVDAEIKQKIANCVRNREVATPAPSPAPQYNGKIFHDPTPAPQPQAPRKAGLLQTMINLLKVKPIMFRSDDYPPKI